MTELAVSNVIPCRTDLHEEPGFRNEGELEITDEHVRVTTFWWNWARHMAWPLGLVTSDLAMIFAGPATTDEMVLTFPRSQLEFVSVRPRNRLLSRVELVGTRFEDGKRWRCLFAYREEDAPIIEELAAAVPAAAA